MMITFIRHCECYLVNKDGSANFMRVNPPLTYEGIQRAKDLTGTFDYVVISPMSRCIETFTYSQIDTQSREINSLFREFISCPGDFHHNDSAEIMTEDIHAFRKRVKHGMDYLLSLQYKYRNICVVTHSEWIKEALNLNYIPNFGEQIMR